MKTRFHTLIIYSGWLWVACMLWCMCLLTSCESGFGTMGESASAQLGLPFYIAFQHNGKPDSAAMFFWRGQWWMYHPDIGSEATVYNDPLTIPKSVVLAINGATGPISIQSTPANVPWQPLFNGCLPDAIIGCQKYGGGIMIEPNHAERIP